MDQIIQKCCTRTLPGIYGVVDRIGHQLLGHLGGHLPAYDLAGVDVGHERCVGPAGTGPAVREIGHPQTVRRAGDEMPRDPIRSLGSEENRRRLQNRVGPLEFGVLPAQLAQDLGFLAGLPSPISGVDLGLADPFAHRLGGTDAQQISNPAHRLPLRDRVAAQIGHHLHRSRLQLVWIPLR